MKGYYILEGKNVKYVGDLIKWATWFETADRIVKSDMIDGIYISTVFLGIDHGYPFEEVPPILFETMIFGGEEDGYQERYSTWEQAEAGHEKAIGIVKAEILLNKIL